MSKRSAKVCSTPGCPQFRPCPTHTPKPYASSTRKYRTPPNWEHLRTTTLNRANHRCELNYPGCTVNATICDHKIPGAFGGSDQLDNLQAACTHCHDIKSKAEAAEGRRRGQR